MLRRCLSERVPLDEVEVLCTDVSTLSPVLRNVRAVAKRRFEHRRDTRDLSGRDTLRGNSGRGGALVAWLAWVQNGFPQRGLIQMIQEGLLEFPDTREC